MRSALTEVVVTRYFAHEFEGARQANVVRYETPGLWALNFHFIEALGGGQFGTLRVDALAKGKAQQLLDIPVRVPSALLGDQP